MGSNQDKPKTEYEPIQFNRFKKKTLSLLVMIYPDDLELLEQIKYKKLIQCFSKELISKYELEERECLLIFVRSII